MPRKSPFVINLTDYEKMTLESAARKYTSSYKAVIRAKIVLLAAQGYDNDEIALRLALQRNVILLFENFM